MKQNLQAPEFPQSIILEPTNACNLRCRMCPVYGEGVKKSREVGFIKEEIYKKIIDEIGSWPGLVNLDIHGAGEPLLNSGFFNRVRRAKSKKYNAGVSVRCNDSESRKSSGDYITGDFPAESLHDIWCGERFNKVRSLHENSQQDGIYLCNTCNTPLFHKYEERAIQKNGKTTIIKKELDLIKPDFAIACDIPLKKSP